MFLEHIVYGWDRLEGPLLASVAMGYPVVLIARHGTAKSLVMRALGAALGCTTRMYFAPVEDLTSLAGLPNPKAMADGQFSLVPHGRSLQGVQVVGIDELPRAPAPVQNLLLEVVLYRTILGVPLDAETVIATMNPDTYAASNSLDPALADRFAMTLPVPTLQNLEPDQRQAMLEVGYSGGMEPEELAPALTGLPEFLDEVRACYRTLETDFLTAVQEYGANLLCLTHGNHPDVYISPRRENVFVRCILACTAYFLAAGLEVGEALSEGAQDAIEYGLAVPLDVPPESLLAYHGNLRSLLTQGYISERDRYLLDISTCDGAKALLLYLEDTTEQAARLLTPAEIEKHLGRLLDASNLGTLRLWRIVKNLAPDSEPLHARTLALLTDWYYNAYRRLRMALGANLVPDDVARQQAAHIVDVVEAYRGPDVTMKMVNALEHVLALLDKGGDATTAADVLQRALDDAGDSRQS
jgi:MoxR-like ATPase